MASVPCSVQLHCPPSNCNASGKEFGSGFLPPAKALGWSKASQLRAKVGVSCRRGAATCWFKFGTNGVDAEGAGIYGSQGRNDFSHYDVEQYFDYMGLLAVEGSYDKVEALLKQNIAPVDILLMMAASEGDTPKIEELMRAGARFDVKDMDGKTALEKAESDEIRELILGFSVKKV